jgi:hypothetical protein
MNRWQREENDNYLISEESAEKAVHELLDFYECDTTRSDPKHEKALCDNLDDLVKAYRRGDFENQKDDVKGFCVIQHVKMKNGKDTITYRELGGKDRILIEGLGENQYYSKLYAVLGKLCGHGEDLIAKLTGRDWRNASLIGMVFIMASSG